MFCQNCGKQVREGQAICLNCGFAIKGVKQQSNRVEGKVVAAVLCWFMGLLGVHRFYLGYPKAGLLILAITLVGCVLIFPLIASCVMVLIDFYKIVTFDGEDIGDVFLKGEE